MRKFAINYGLGVIWGWVQVGIWTGVFAIIGWPWKQHGELLGYLGVTAMLAYGAGRNTYEHHQN